MSLKCLFGHQWNGCKCERCGEIRNEQHDWDLCKGKCKRCGATQPVQHDWDLCNGKCKRCGATQPVEHDWKNAGNGWECSRCGKKPDATVYRVVTMGKLPPHDGTPCGYGFVVTHLWHLFDDVVRNDASYQNTKASFPNLHEEFADLISQDLINKPLQWLASATGDSIDTISTLTGTRLFMIQNAIQWRTEIIEFSVCDYFWRNETAEIPCKSNTTNENNKNCPYYKDNKCVAGGQVNSCSANPQSYANCFVYKYNSTGDISVLY